MSDSEPDSSSDSESDRESFRNESTPTKTLVSPRQIRAGENTSQLPQLTQRISVSNGFKSSFGSISMEQRLQGCGELYPVATLCIMTSFASFGSFHSSARANGSQILMIFFLFYWFNSRSTSSMQFTQQSTKNGFTTLSSSSVLLFASSMDLRSRALLFCERCCDPPCGYSKIIRMVL